MLGLRRRWRERGQDPAPQAAELEGIVDDFPGDDATLGAEIARLSGTGPDPAGDRELLRLRHIAGLRVLGSNGRRPVHPDASGVELPTGDPLPEFGPKDLSPELMRAAILRDGCVLVRGLVGRDDALSFADDIERAFAERERVLAGADSPDGYYEEIAPGPGHEFQPGQREWIQACGGVLAADSPLLMSRMLELLDAVSLPELVRGYLGEPALLTVQKTTLRKADPSVAGAWHQDGAFMGDVRALNLWVAFSRCGDEAPGLDIVPRRLDGIVTTHTDEAKLSFQVSDAKAAEAAGEIGIARPIFEPGDALLFDDVFLHKTASDPAMPKPRYAVESWFFGASGFPPAYGPIAI